MCHINVKSLCALIPMFTKVQIELTSAGESIVAFQQCGTTRFGTVDRGTARLSSRFHRSLVPL